MPDRTFGTTHNQHALLRTIAEAYRGDSRVLAVGVFGSVGRGTWDEWSDLDLDVIVADDMAVDAVSEARMLCRHLDAEDALIVSIRTGEVDLVFPSLQQCSMRYHPLGTTNVRVAGVEGGVDRFGDRPAQVVAGDEMSPHVPQRGLGLAVLTGGHDRLDAPVRALREQAQQQPASQRVSIDHLAGGHRGVLAGELGQPIGVLEQVYLVDGAPPALTLVAARR